VVSGPKFTNIFSLNAGGNAVVGFQILDISILFEDIRAQSKKGSKIGPNFAPFPNFFWADPQIFGPAL